MTTIRTARAAEGRFTQLANAMLRDHRLGLDTRGLIAYMLSLPPDTRFARDSLAKQVPAGRDAVGRMLREAEQYGYLTRAKRRGTLGHWIWEHVISDGPLAETTDGFPVNGATSGNSASSQVVPSTGFPYDGEPVDKGSNTEPPNTGETRSTGAPSGRPVGQVLANSPRRNARGGAA